MPGIFYHRIDRRNFLVKSAKTAAFLTLVRSAASFAQQPLSKENRLHLGLISDTHIAADPKSEFRNFQPVENLKAALSQVIAARPEAVIHCGDAARMTGEVADYEQVKTLLAPLAAEVPAFLMLGNHDDRSNFLKVFEPPTGSRQTIADKYVLVFERPWIRFILLDSLLYPNKVSGLLGKAQRTWLEQFLARSDGRPTIIFVHHTLGDGDLDLLDVERLFKIVRPQVKVKAIFYGHSHEYSFAQEQGIHLINLPAVGYNFKDNDPVGWVNAIFTTEGIDLTLKALGGNRKEDGKTTSLVWRT